MLLTRISFSNKTALKYRFPPAAHLIRLHRRQLPAPGAALEGVIPGSAVRRQVPGAVHAQNGGRARPVIGVGPAARGGTVTGLVSGHPRAERVTVGAAKQEGRCGQRRWPVRSMWEAERATLATESQWGEGRGAETW
ncbi:hypothetical protein NDU88_007396 [Pleurodeles waltl]|uniref:Uncharacterized protein n=1 Tax=Pleurodeles waltl TaxID=8319 RepID=A0AAV7SSI4_PLEWA|nr:hypothetical protein NDU88_007396 [Pleurodeles waltl]